MRWREGPDYENPLWNCVGRTRPFAVQTAKGSYFPVDRELTSEDLAEHEAGFSSIGTYTLLPVKDEFMCHFIVFDLDVMGQSELDWLVACVEYAVDPLGDPGSYECLMLESSGGKGYHIWLFLDQWVPAYKARAWLDQRFWTKYRDGAATQVYDKLEVFPKQDRLSEGGLGNLTKLPFGIHAVSGNRSELVVNQGWILEVSDIQGMDTAEILAVPDQAPEQRLLVTRNTPTGVLLTDGPVARFLKGEVADGERNICFHAFFTWCAWNVHLPSDLAWDWWERLNDALPEPEDDEDSARKTMESAYTRPPADAAAPRRERTAVPTSGVATRPSLKERVAARRSG